MTTASHVCSEKSWNKKLPVDAPLYNPLGQTKGFCWVDENHDGYLDKARFVFNSRDCAGEWQANNVAGHVVKNIARIRLYLENGVDAVERGTKVCQLVPNPHGNSKHIFGHVFAAGFQDEHPFVDIEMTTSLLNPFSQSRPLLRLEQGAPEYCDPDAADPHQIIPLDKRYKSRVLADICIASVAGGRYIKCDIRNLGPVSGKVSDEEIAYEMPLFKAGVRTHVTYGYLDSFSRSTGQIRMKGRTVLLPAATDEPPSTYMNPTWHYSPRIGANVYKSANGKILTPDKPPYGPTPLNDPRLMDSVYKVVLKASRMPVNAANLGFVQLLYEQGRFPQMFAMEGDSGAWVVTHGKDMRSVRVVGMLHSGGASIVWHTNRENAKEPPPPEGGVWHESTRRWAIDIKGYAVGSSIDSVLDTLNGGRRGDQDAYKVCGDHQHPIADAKGRDDVLAI